MFPDHSVQRANDQGSKYDLPQTASLCANNVISAATSWFSLTYPRIPPNMAKLHDRSHAGCNPCGGVRVSVADGCAALAPSVPAHSYLLRPGFWTANVRRHIGSGQRSWRTNLGTQLSIRTQSTRRAVFCSQKSNSSSCAAVSTPLPPATSKVSIGPRRLRNVVVPVRTSPQFVATDLRRVVLGSSTL